MMRRNFIYETNKWSRIVSIDKNEKLKETILYLSNWYKVKIIGFETSIFVFSPNRYYVCSYDELASKLLWYIYK